MYIEIYLEYPKDLLGICHIESVILYNGHGKKIKDYQELVDNHDFNYSDGEDVHIEVVNYVAEVAKIDKNSIHIMN